MTSPLLNMAAVARHNAQTSLEAAEGNLRLLAKVEGVKTDMKAALNSVLIAKRRLRKAWPLRTNSRRTSKRRSSRR